MLKVIGVISDTHNLLRPEIYSLLQGSDLIIHSGDIGSTKILEELRTIAPVIAVKGNTDKGELANSIPATEVVDIGGKFIYIIHDISQLDLEPVAAGFHAVIYGHSHKPKIEWKEGVLYLNSGSAGPKRFKLPISVAIVKVNDDDIQAEILLIQT